MITIPVPGRFSGTYLDLETRKVPSVFVMANGEMLRKRWQAFLAGVAYDTEKLICLLETKDDDELEFLGSLGTMLDGVGEVRYAATRQFDEMILRGRFTNARRAHASQPFFPAMPGAEELTWNNLGPLTHVDRDEDLPSKGISEAYQNGRRELVLVHLLRDVAEMILSDGMPSARCERWCREVLTEQDVAYEAVFGS